MKAKDVRAIREWLGLSVDNFAAAVMVNYTTVYRWESAKGDLRLDWMHQALLEALHSSLSSMSPAKRSRCGGRIEQLLYGSGSKATGALRALAALLDVTGVVRWAT